MTTEREELARVLASNEFPFPWQLLKETAQYEFLRQADTLLASEWLRERDATKWAEGFDAGERDVFEHDRTGWEDLNAKCIPNPYGMGRKDDDE